MHASVNGSTGFIGSALMRKLVADNWTATRINRDSFSMSDQEFLEKKIEGADVVFNLSGTPIIKRWTDANKKEMYESRIPVTRKIVETIRRANVKPKLLISSAAVGIYDQEHQHTESSADFDTGFLGTLCRDWENEALAARDVTRVAVFRTGLVMGKDGGALERMQFPFSIGLGATVGSGKQAMSWIHMEDLLDAYAYVIGHEEIDGIVNAVAPYATTNSHFTQTLGKIMNQPTFLAIPGFVLKLIYGNGAEALIAGQKVIPEKLLKAGFEFKFPTIEKALMNIYK